jgi:hypothetical protein
LDFSIVALKKRTEDDFVQLHDWIKLKKFGGRDNLQAIF